MPRAPTLSFKTSSPDKYPPFFLFSCGIVFAFNYYKFKPAGDRSLEEIENVQ
jgi:hypothetical protein